MNIILHWNGYTVKKNKNTSLHPKETYNPCIITMVTDYTTQSSGTWSRACEMPLSAPLGRTAMPLIVTLVGALIDRISL